MNTFDMNIEYNPDNFNLAAALREIADEIEKGNTGKQVRGSQNEKLGQWVINVDD